MLWGFKRVEWGPQLLKPANGICFLPSFRDNSTIKKWQFLSVFFPRCSLLSRCLDVRCHCATNHSSVWGLNPLCTTGIAWICDGASPMCTGKWSQGRRLKPTSDPHWTWLSRSYITITWTHHFFSQCFSVFIGGSIHQRALQGHKQVSSLQVPPRINTRVNLYNLQ